MESCRFSVQLVEHLIHLGKWIWITDRFLVTGGTGTTGASFGPNSLPCSKQGQCCKTWHLVGNPSAEFGGSCSMFSEIGDILMYWCDRH